MKNGQISAEPRPTTVPTIQFAAAARSGGGASATIAALPAPMAANWRRVMEARVLISPSLPLQSLQIMSCDLSASRAPHMLMAANIVQRCVESADPVRHTREIGMQRDRHYSPAFSAFPVKSVELTTDHLAEFVRSAVELLERRLVVDLQRIRYRDQIPLV